MIRLAVLAGLSLAMGGAALAQEGAETPRPVAAEECTPTNPCTDIEPGAASKEPEQALEDPAEVEASRAHAKWVEEIWTSP
ncbi:MAG TPA: hypothetical protein VFM53_04305 [Anaeromyxobacteraceae bacterium]|jgi:hypothetical protein|nr:hypothetical protein [Anaeromyxobacteraceae bacterium]